MSINEQRIREFAYQIWESEGKPHGHSDRHWDMAHKLASSHAESEPQQMAANDSNEPIEPISPGQPAHPTPNSQPIQPNEPSQQPAQPTDPISEPDQLATSVAAVSPPRKTRAKAAANTSAKSLIDTQPIAIAEPAKAKKTSRAKKPKATENESA